MCILANRPPAKQAAVVCAREICVSDRTRASAEVAVVELTALCDAQDSVVCLLSDRQQKSLM